MSVTNVPTSVRYCLWGRAAGRCEYRGCNHALYRDDLTKAEFNTSYIGGADPANPWMALSTGAQQITESYQQFDSLCANIKNEKITVYTVGFDLNVPDALAHLASCASAPENFYDVKTGAQLKDAFKDIANKLGNLRVAS